MDWRLLDIEFQISENPGLESLDPRFIDIAGLIQESNFSVAAGQAQEIIEEQIYDIRIICYFLYGVFDEQGPDALYGILKVLTGILSENWDAVGPVKNKEKLAKNSLAWLFKQTSKILETQEKKEGTRWQQWLDSCSADEIYEAMEIVGGLKSGVSSSLEKYADSIIDQISKIAEWLDSFYRLIYQEPPPEEAELDSESETEDTEDFDEDADSFESDDMPDESEKRP